MFLIYWVAALKASPRFFSRTCRARRFTNWQARTLVTSAEVLEERVLLDGVVVEFDWTHQFGTGIATEVWDIAVDGWGGVYVAGETFGALSGQTSQGHLDAFVRKYDASGQELWTRQFGTDDPRFDGHIDVAKAIAVDELGGVYVAGYVSGTLPGQTSDGSFDVFVRKYDTSGQELWTRQFGSSGRVISGYTDHALAIAVDGSGAVYIAGDVFGTLPGQTSAGAADAFVRKYDADGREIWTRQFGTMDDDLARRIAVDDSGGVYVAGYVSGILPGQTSAGARDAFVRKYDASGRELWTRQFGDSDSATGITVDPSGVYVSGYISGALPGQAFVRKYDSSGGELWTQQFAGASWAIVADGSGGVYVGGSTEGALPGQTSAGALDAFVRKYSASGRELWTRQFGSGDHDWARGIAVLGTRVYVAGGTHGTLSGQTNTEALDVFVSRLNSYSHFVSVLTHGFNPTPFDREGFLAPWRDDYTESLEQLVLGTELEGNHSIYTSNWESSTGWYEALGWAVAYVALNLTPTASPLAPLALSQVQAMMGTARRNALYAAHAIVDDLTRSYLADPDVGQSIHLIGHSRGGAVNAMASRLLHERGYAVAQYTAIDGFATDWPNVSALLGDSFIVGMAAADRLVNYLVEDALGVTHVNLLLHAALQSIVGLPSAPMIAASQQLMKSLNWRAPGRSPTFEDELVVGTPLSGPSHHLNVTSLYFGGFGAGPRYMLNSPIGVELGGATLGNGRPEDVTVAQPAGLADSEADFFTAFSAEDVTNFLDGSFEVVGELWQQLDSLDESPQFDEAFLTHWLQAVRDPAHLTRTIWNGEGGVRLVRENGNTLLEFSQSEDSSIGQDFVLPEQAPTLAFDLVVRGNGGAEGVLEITFDGRVVYVVDLTSTAISASHRVSLAGLEGKLGRLAFRLTGASAGRTVVRIDDLLIESAQSRMVVLEAGPDRSALEGDSITLAGASFAFNADSAGLAGAVDWGDGTVEALVLVPGPGGGTFANSHVYADDGSYVVLLTLSDQTGATVEDSLTIAVANAEPLITGIANGGAEIGNASEGRPVTFSATFTDAGFSDTHSAIIDWGNGTTSDGAVTSTAGTGTVSASHVYGEGGVYTITIVLRDDDGGEAIGEATAYITGAGVHGGVLQVVGTQGNDQVAINAQGKGAIKLHASFLPDRGKHRTFPLGGVTSILVLLGEGNDHSTIAGNVSVPVLLDGGPGDDHLNGGAGPNILIGGPGNDRLIGGRGRNLLIGGFGADELMSQSREDILIGGWTTFDGDTAALRSLLAEWLTSRSQAERIANLTGTGPRENDEKFLKFGLTVFNDDDSDRLNSGPDRDWIFGSLNDRLQGRLLDDVFATDADVLLT